jgi:hypothetical protein
MGYICFILLRYTPLPTPFYFVKGPAWLGSSEHRASRPRGSTTDPYTPNLDPARAQEEERQPEADISAPRGSTTSPYTPNLDPACAQEEERQPEADIGATRLDHKPYTPNLDPARAQEEERQPEANIGATRLDHKPLHPRAQGLQLRRQLVLCKMRVRPRPSCPCRTAPTRLS